MRTNCLVERYSVTEGTPGRTKPSRVSKGDSISGFSNYLSTGKTRTDAGEKVNITLVVYFWVDPGLERKDSITLGGSNFRVVSVLPRSLVSSITQYEVECTEEDRVFS